MGCVTFSGEDDVKVAGALVKKGRKGDDSDACVRGVLS